MEAVVRRTYLEKPVAGGAVFVDLTIRSAAGGSFVVEEVVGRVNHGVRRGTIRHLDAALDPAAADALFAQRGAERVAQGFRASGGR